ncbi:MAG TPA: methyltransferase domain-containing protein [Kiritimatiellia bacterium]|nr:methyltransferase domain-containing protein [Kiritimatiellia bacterium]
MDDLSQASGVNEQVRAPLDFRARWDGVELMDDPNCDEALLIRTLEQFRWMNRLVSRYRAILTRWVLSDMGKDPGREYHLVDLGSGGCDIPVWLLREAEKKGLRLRVTALDGDSRAIAFAKERHGGMAGLDIQHADIMAMNRFGPVDYLFTNHVLHHLPDRVIPGLLRMMHQTAIRCWLVSDLKRSAWSYAGFQLLGRFFRDSFAFEDGKRSIRRGFRVNELEGYLDESGVKDKAYVHSFVPGRLVIVGRGEASVLAT